MDKPKLLIVESDAALRGRMSQMLAAEYDVLVAEDRQSGLRLLEKERPAVATVSLKLQNTPADQGSVPLLSELLQCDPLLKIIVITQEKNKSDVAEAIALGAHHFLCQPLDLDELNLVLTRAFYLHELECERREHTRGIQFDSFEGIIGASPAVQSVFAAIRKIATTSADVLITGESGTGKGMAAHAIHRLSSRAAGQFVVINCGAIPENLLERELFGEQGHGSSRIRTLRLSRIETAQNGTLFLDEISDLSASLQMRLLRFLEQHRIERDGRHLHVDTRVIAATNVDLVRAMKEGRFREDLYEQLAEVTISMPPLRDRQGDVAILATALLQRYGSMQGRSLTFTQRAVKAIESHAWPGNIHELEKRIQTAAIMAENGRVTPEDLELSSLAVYEGKSLGKARHELERRMIEAAIARNHGNLSRAALELEISRPTLYELMDKLGISRKSA